MGYYIQTSGTHGKADEIAKVHDGEVVPQPSSFKDIPSTDALICVVNNGYFEAAGFAFNEEEFLAFTRPDDPRPKKFVIISRKLAMELTGYERSK